MWQSAASCQHAANSQMAEAADELGLVHHVGCDLHAPHGVHQLVPAAACMPWFTMGQYRRVDLRAIAVCHAAHQLHAHACGCTCCSCRQAPCMHAHVAAAAAAAATADVRSAVSAQQPTAAAGGCQDSHAGELLDRGLHHVAGRLDLVRLVGHHLRGRECGGSGRGANQRRQSATRTVEAARCNACRPPPAARCRASVAAPAAPLLPRRRPSHGADCVLGLFGRQRAAQQHVRAARSQPPAGRSRPHEAACACPAAIRVGPCTSGRLPGPGRR